MSTPAFTLLGVTHLQTSFTVPDNTIGANGDIGTDTAGNVYQKQAGAWVALSANVTASNID